jgi:hypothetical protein
MVVWKILLGAVAVHLAGAAWLLSRSKSDGVERRLARIQVFLGAGMFFGFLPSAFGWSGFQTAVVPRVVGGLLFLATLWELRRPRQGRLKNNL